jgi:hypothetical protein
VVDFGKIVVFAGEPEDWRVGTASSRGLASSRYRCGRFEGREERTPEQAHLLSGDDRTSALSERLERSGCWRTLGCGILFCKQVDQFRPVTGEWGARLPACIRRQRRIKPADCGIACAVVQKQPVQTRRHGNRKAVCGQQSILVLLKVNSTLNFGPVAARQTPNRGRQKLNQALLRMPRRIESMHKSGQGNPVNSCFA